MVRHVRLTSVFALAYAFVVAGCLASPARPGELEDAQDTPAVTGVQSAADTACEAGQEVPCAAATGYAAGGFVACAAGQRTCGADGAWSTCSAAKPVRADPSWSPEDVGCTWPPQACSDEDAVRTCRHRLPSVGSVENCTEVTEVCFGGTWRPCADDPEPRHS